MAKSTGDENLAGRDRRLGSDGTVLTLWLSGPAGGVYRSGSGGEDIELDAVEFCRILWGQAPGDAQLTTQVAF